MKFTLKGSLIMVLSLAVFMVGFSAQQETTEIGMITPLTGGSAKAGLEMKRGAMLALDEINQAGGVLGRPLKIIVEDGESTAKASVDAAHKLVNIDGVPLIIGVWGSGPTIPTAEYTNSQGVVQIVGIASSPKVRNIGPYYFSGQPLDDIRGPMLARGAHNLFPEAKKYASIVVNNAFGVGIEKFFCKEVEEFGGECLVKVRYEGGKPNYRAELQRLFEVNPDVVNFVAYGKASKVILKNAYELGLEPNDAWVAMYPDMWKTTVIPETAEGIIGLREGPKESPRMIRDFEIPYREKYGDEAAENDLSLYSYYGYDAAWMAAMAINFAGSMDPDDIRRAIPNVWKRYEGVTGDKDVDEDGISVRIEQNWVKIHNGEYVSIPAPAEVKVGD